MKKIVLLTLTLIATMGNLVAQHTIDSELHHLIDIVSVLRQRDTASWNEASRAFLSDKMWTIMDEVIPHPDEAPLFDRTLQQQRFGLNRILSQRMGYEENQTRGEFNNGEDPNFFYSLIERSVKAKSTVCYQLKSRQGEQYFVIMPFNPTDAKNLKVKATLNGKSVGKTSKDDEGYIILYISKDKHIGPTDEIQLEITNSSNNSIAFVIFNHNTREQ